MTRALYVVMYAITFDKEALLFLFVCINCQITSFSPKRTTCPFFVLSCALRQWRRGNNAWITTLPILDCLDSVEHLQPRCLEDRFLPQETIFFLKKCQRTITSSHRVPSRSELRFSAPVAHSGTRPCHHTFRGDQDACTLDRFREAHWSTLKSVCVH